MSVLLGISGAPSVKDKICTDVSLGMDTTCGSYALVGSVPQHNAPIVDHLLKAGMIVIGKANLSVGKEWLKRVWHNDRMVSGRRTNTVTAPAGSSSGSASGATAGFAPLAIATETDGSITQPANRAALFGIKVTVGRASTEGTAPWSVLTDSVGGQTVGFVDDTFWGLSEFVCIPDPVLITQQREAYMDTKKKLIEHGATLHKNVPMTSVDELQLDGDDALDQLWNHDFAKAWEKFLKNFPSSSMKSIADILKFNKLNAKVALPAAKTNGIDKTTHQFGLDVIVGPMDGRMPTIAAAAGYPVETVPLGYSQTNGRPFGLAIVAMANEEHKILQFMTAWDELTPSRLPPLQLMNWNSPK
ncbi:hypothetical protein BELL_0526g00060 [Botrytis elliptica]|uniref:Amidase domain-containing protein n=1 Tax=Botrytis elliptica TaxID=278938 RepID=A0A4Z1JE63_9HELO|nr:hypothetical protein EAE99_001923 [Botrytis elliptica]TGO71816.1 hypothetical protein BELL_0526g00060 [Botrytis elliptica]